MVGKYTASQEEEKKLAILLLEVSIVHQIQASSYSICLVKKKTVHVKLASMKCCYYLDANGCRVRWNYD